MQVSLSHACMLMSRSIEHSNRVYIYLWQEAIVLVALASYSEINIEYISLTCCMLGIAYLSINNLLNWVGARNNVMEKSQFRHLLSLSDTDMVGGIFRRKRTKLTWRVVVLSFICGLTGWVKLINWLSYIMNSGCRSSAVAQLFPCLPAGMNSRTYAQPPRDLDRRRIHSRSTSTRITQASKAS